jgi:hypothetical protein
VDVVLEVLSFFTRQLVLVLAMGLLLAILWGWGQGLGLPLLFWQPPGPGDTRTRLGRFLIGVATGVFLGTCLFVGLLVESGTHTESGILGFQLRLRIWSGAAGVLLLVVWRFGRYRFRRPRPTSDGATAKPIVPIMTLEAAIWALLGNVCGVLAIDVLATILPDQVPSSLWRLLTDLVRWLPSAEPVIEGIEIHATAAALASMAAVSYLLLAFLNRVAGWRPYPAVALVMILTTLSGVHGFIGFRFPRAQVGVYVLLAVIYAALNARFQRARVADLERLPSVQSPAALLSDGDALVAWRGQARAKDKDAKPNLVVIAADGGGIRAGLWTATVLTSIEERLGSDFPSHVRLITGASGGMLGATHWVATLDPARRGVGHVCPAAAAGKTRAIDTDELLHAIELGSLTSIASSMVFRDLLPPPCRFGEDRGRSLEAAWEEHTGGVLAESFASLLPGEREGWRPSLALTPMIVDDGRRLVISNLELEPLLRSGGPLLSPSPGKPAYSIGAVSLFEHLPGAQAGLRLSTAVRLQANFPWVLPATELRPLRAGERRLRVVDAGYYDETGVDLAVAWLWHNRVWLREHTGGVALLQIRDTSSIGRRERPTEPRGFWECAFDGALTPVSAVLRAKDSTTWFKNDEKVAALADSLGGEGRPFFTTGVFELPVEASLSWSLTADEAQQIRAGMEGSTTLDELVKWWNPTGVQGVQVA